MRSHCGEAKEVVLLYSQKAQSPGKGMNMGKIKDILQLLAAWQDVIIQLLSNTFQFEVKIPGMLSLSGFLFISEHISNCCESPLNGAELQTCRVYVSWSAEHGKGSTEFQVNLEFALELLSRKQ